MKNTKFILALMAWALLLPLAQVQAEEGCRIKEEKLERKLAMARAANNPWQASGLERALAEVRRNCSEPRLKARNDFKTHQNDLKIEEKEEKVREREMELREARRKGDQKKIIKREKKLREAVAELEEARAKRDLRQ